MNRFTSFKTQQMVQVIQNLKFNWMQNKKISVNTLANATRIIILPFIIMTSKQKLKLENHAKKLPLNDIEKS